MRALSSKVLWWLVFFLLFTDILVTVYLRSFEGYGNGHKRWLMYYVLSIITAAVISFPILTQRKRGIAFILAVLAAPIVFTRGAIISDPFYLIAFNPILVVYNLFGIGLLSVGIFLEKKFRTLNFVARKILVTVIVLFSAYLLVTVALNVYANIR